MRQQREGLLNSFGGSGCLSSYKIRKNPLLSQEIAAGNQAMIKKSLSSTNSVECPVCETGDCGVFFELLDVPVNVCIQWPSRWQSLDCPKGDITLAFCEKCGFVWNSAFEADRLDYSQAYENSLFFSKVYQDYTNGVVERLIKKYRLRNKDIIDIGCGKGDFLEMLCRQGANRGVGFDTSYECTTDEKESLGDIEIIRDFYSEKYSNYGADLICSRYVFEHIENPRRFLGTVRKAIGDRRTAVYFEVPNVSLILKELSVWDIIYEHCSYFSLSSLDRIFRLCAFDVLDIYESYGGQFLGIEALPANGNIERAAVTSGQAEEISDAVKNFVRNSRRQINAWRQILCDLRAEGKKSVLWGAGSKGVSFLNMLDITGQISYVVDINPRKHGRFVAGTGQRIVPPQFLKSYKPDSVILTNPLYKKEIEKVTGDLGVEPVFIL